MIDEIIANNLIINNTKQWINDVVIGCNFCPFAAKVVKQNSIHYQVSQSANIALCLKNFELEMQRLNDNNEIETSFLIFVNAFKNFNDFLNAISKAEKILSKKGYDGIYQLASFHPNYLFENSTENDAANYTNRSIYPMFHLLRESSVDKALAHFKNPEKIPHTNINYAREKGLAYMKTLKDSCTTV
jgi:uncharacterized protein